MLPCLQAHKLTSEQIIAGLPPIGLGGSVDLDSVVSGSTREWLQAPEKLIKDRSEWPS